MLRAVIAFCLNYRLIVLMLAAGLLVWGGMAARQAPWDVFPEFAPPQIVVQTESPGLSTEEVEQLVTLPVESAVSGVFGLETLRSSSAPGLSVVTAIFEEGTNILDARQLVGERLLEAAPMLPAMAQPPHMTPLKSSLSKLAMIGLTSEMVSPRDLRSFADWTLKGRLLAVHGVAQVEIFGGEVQQYQVLVAPSNCGNTTSPWTRWSAPRKAPPASAARVMWKRPISGCLCSSARGSSRPPIWRPRRSPFAMASR